LYYKFYRRLPVKENGVYFLNSKTSKTSSVASSFSSQIPCVVHLLDKLRPQTILDIGKGFGKYGFLVHEYVGIDNQKQLNPELSMSQQSRVCIDCIEVDRDLLLPHLTQFYNNVFVGDVFDIYQTLPRYDLVLMIDVIEHLDKEKAISLLKYYISKRANIIIATPVEFFEQKLYESEYENHISHWRKADFEKIGYLDYQRFDSGMVYLLSGEKREIRGFGKALIKKLRRIARTIRNEF